MSEHTDNQAERDSILAALAVSRPDSAVSVKWELNESFEWNGDGPDPIEEGYYPHEVTVTARTIRGGKMIEGTSCLGGSYSEFNGPHCPMIHGDFPQMLDEAIAELDAELAKLGA